MIRSKAIQSVPIFALLFIICEVGNLTCEPTIRQIFPKQSVYLGEAIDWVIEVRNPLWESYELSLRAPEGADMKIIDTKKESIGNEIRSVYRIQIVAQSFTVNGTPSVIIADGRGRNSVLNGKPLQVRTISGDSLQIKEPDIPRFPPVQNRKRLALAGGGIFVLIALLIYLRIRRKRDSSPRFVLLRQLKRSHQELKSGTVRNPLVLSRLLRSELLWGFPAESFTASELKEKADEKQQKIAEALDSLDMMRYARESEAIDSKKIEEALQVAIEIMLLKRSEKNNTGVKAA